MVFLTLPPKYFRSSLLNSIGKHPPNKETPLETLQERKKYLEHYFAVMEGTDKIMEQNGDKIYYHSHSNRKMRFGDCKYLFMGAMGLTEADFIDWWLKQDTRRSYRSVETRPPPLITSRNVLNLWEGFPIEKVQYDPNSDISPILKLMRSVAGDEDSYQYLLKWFAHKVQFPGMKTEVALVFYSETEGTGKTSIAESIMKGFLMDMSKSLMLATDTINDVIGKFANAGERLWVVLNEANMGDIVGKTNPLKSFITDTTFHRERKGVDSEQVDNIAELIFTTNNANAVKVSPTDRRYMIFEADSTHANDPVYFRPIHKALKDPTIMRSLFEMFKNIDIADFHPSTHRPRSNIYKEFLHNSLSTVQRFFIHLFDEQYTDDEKNSDVWKTVEDWYEDYRTYCVIQGKGNNIVAENHFSRQARSVVKGIKESKRYVDEEPKPKQRRGLLINFSALGEWCDNMRVNEYDE